VWNVPHWSEWLRYRPRVWFMFHVIQPRSPAMPAIYVIKATSYGRPNRSICSRKRIM